MIRRSLYVALVVVGFVTFHSAHDAQALVITPTFASNIANDVNAAAIESTINSAIAVYENLFTNNVTVNLAFQEMSSGLGQSSTYVNTISYNQFLTAFSTQATTAVAQQALAHIQADANGNNPINGSGFITLTTANLRALGFTDPNADFPPPGQFDSTIGLNMSLMNIGRTNIDKNKYDLMAVTMHEIDEALGLLSSLDGSANGGAKPTGAINIMDLYRYDANGVRSFNTTKSSLAYFSIDGTTKVEQFNQTAGADFHDWASGFLGSPQVQDAFGTPGGTANLGVAEITALEAAGYNGPAVPEPASLLLLALGLPIAAYLLNKRRMQENRLSV